jgi:hypothetical protein
MNNAHAHELQNLIIAVYETQMREPSGDPDANQRGDDHFRQSQRGNRTCGQRFV